MPTEDTPNRACVPPRTGSLAGFGLGLYGARARRDDGSIVKTVCVCALYIPLFPVSAYRVVDRDDGVYQYLERESLSRLARTYRLVVPLALILAVSTVLVARHLGSADRLAAKAIATADGIADPIEATAAYEKILTTWQGHADDRLIEQAARKAIATRVSRIPTPLSIGSQEIAFSLLARYLDYPAVARSKANSDYVVKHVLRWASDIAKDPDGTLDDAVRLLTKAEDLSGDSRSQFAERLQTLEIDLAESIAARRPRDALAMLVRATADELARDLIGKLAASPSLARESSALIAAWLARNRAPEVRAMLGRAQEIEADLDRVNALASGDGAALRSALLKFPDDHELAVRMSIADLAAGDPTLAAARLKEIAEPGWLTSNAQRTLARALVSLGQLEEADRILAGLVRFGLPRYRRKLDAYLSARKSLAQSLRRQLDGGAALPGPTGGSDKERAEWIAAAVEVDPNVRERREATQRDAEIAHALISLGNIRLQRADRSKGKKRSALLESAKEIFGQLAKDSPDPIGTELGLAAVTVRLGNTTEGVRILDRLLESGSGESALRVAQTYRELGLRARAAEILKRVVAGSDGVVRERAAAQLALLASSLEERIRWLALAGNGSPELSALRLTVRAEQARTSGRIRRAIELYTEAAQTGERRAERDAASANNAAVARLSLFELTGQASHLVTARENFERALRLHPANALLVANLADHSEFEGWYRIIAEFLPIQGIALTRGEVDIVVEALRSGSLKNKLAKAGRESSPLARSMELTALENALAPGNPLGWERRILLHARLDDEAGLKATRTALDSVRLDTFGVSPGSENDHREQLDLDVARYEDLLSRVREESRSLVRFLLSSALAKRGWLTASSSDLIRALRLSRLALDQLPSLGEPTIAIAIALAVVRSMESSAEVAAMHAARKLDLNGVLVMAESQADNDHEVRRAPVAADEALLLAAEKAAAKSPPSLAKWVLGSIIETDALIRDGVKVFDDEQRRIELELLHRVVPSSASIEMRWLLYQKRGDLRK